MLPTALMSELLGGSARYRALRCLFEQSRRRFGTRELAVEAGVDPGNASRWLRRWAEVGLVERHEERGAPVFQASTNPDLAPLATLLRQNSAVVEVLRERIASLGEDVHAAAIFGSVARGDADRDSDIDVLLVTPLPQLKVQALLKATGRKLGRAVNVLALAPSAWKTALANGDALVNDVLASPLITLKGKLDAPAKT
jgi:predicted nucleotidyltransferase